MSRLQQLIATSVSVGTEAIDYQGGKLTPAADGVIEELEKVKSILASSSKITNVAVDNALSDLSKAVNKIFNSNFSFELNPVEEIIGAWVEPPVADANHPFYKHFEQYRDGKFKKEVKDRALKGFDLRGATKVGWVDLKNSKLGGVFSEYPCLITFTKGALDKFDTKALAAAIFHEIGHIFSYYEYIVTYLSRNMPLVAVAEALSGETNHLRKVAVLERVKGEMDLTTLDVEMTAGVSDPDKLATLLLDANLTSIRSDFGSDKYDYTAWESQADLFATRHGLGADLARALTMITPGTRSTAKFLFFEVLKTMLTLILTFSPFIFFGVYIAVFAVMMNGLGGDIYDKPERRIKRIREQALGELKSKHLTKEDKRRILDSVKRIDEAAAKFKDRMTLAETISWMLFPGKRKLERDRDIQTWLEKTAYNDLFVSSAKISLIS